MAKKWLARIGTALAVTGGLVAGAAGPASAANSQVVLYDSANDLAASMLHMDDGDKYYIKDHKPDGHGVRGTIQLLESGTWRNVASMYNGNGSGTAVTLWHDVYEGNTYRMRICTVDGAGDTTPVACAYKALYE